MDQPTVLFFVYTMVSAQQTNQLPENASLNGAIFAQSLYLIYQTTSKWLSSYGCTIIVYTHNLVTFYVCTVDTVTLHNNIVVLSHNNMAAT